jgi:hypothetical protein
LVGASALALHPDIFGKWMMSEIWWWINISFLSYFIVFLIGCWMIWMSKLLILVE